MCMSYCIYYYYLVVLGAACMLGKCATTELTPASQSRLDLKTFYFDEGFQVVEAVLEIAL